MIEHWGYRNRRRAIPQIGFVSSAEPFASLCFRIGRYADGSEAALLSHHLRFAQSRALGRKVSDEFTVPLCRGHHREVHRHGDEAAWWSRAGIDPTVTARTLWLEMHPLPITVASLK
jgi:hypothetical protein